MQGSVNASFPAIAAGFEMRNHFRRQPDSYTHHRQSRFGLTSWRQERLRSFRDEKLAQNFTGGSRFGQLLYRLGRIVTVGLVSQDLAFALDVVHFALDTPQMIDCVKTADMAFYAYRTLTYVKYSPGSRREPKKNYSWRQQAKW
jgi:hypothetical protein